VTLRTFFSDARNRLFVLAGFLFLWVIVISGRLVMLQLVQYGDWMQRAQRQQQRTFEVSPPRGVVYDRNGHELAMSIKVDSIFAVPSEVPDQAMAANVLARITGQDAHEILGHLQASHNFCWIARKVDARVSNRVRSLNLRGIYFTKEPKRFYPKGELAAQVLGYVGLDDEGLGGIEREYDDSLHGIAGKMSISMDARRVKLGRAEQRPEPGENVVLTIDEKIQWIVEREIDQAMADTHADAATIVVQNPKTGEILALANRPTFNPNMFRTVPQQALKNRAVSDVYEPGSMFKTVTLSAALEEKVTKPDDRYDVSQGYIVVGGKRMRDAHHMGVLTTAQVLAQSSNVGAIKIGMKLGEDRLYKYMRLYGFGQQTGIELPGETRGLVKPVKNWSKTSIGAMSIGQEVGITALQAVSAVSAIANDGVYTPPRLVAGVMPPGKVQQISFKPAEQHRVISSLTAAQMRKMMEGVVLFGTARRAILDGYSSAGKTGTAQKVDPKTGRYGPYYVGSFVGFAPVNTPAVTIGVIIDSAKGLHQGGQVSAPVFARVAQQVLAYMNVAHDEEPRSPMYLASKRVNDRDLEEDAGDHLGDLTPDSEVASAPATPPSAQPQPVLVAAVMQKALPNAPAPIIDIAQTAPFTMPVPSNGGTVVLDVETGVVVPSFAGKAMRSALEAAEQAGLELEPRGSGMAREQWPAPGTRVSRGSRVVVRFSR
jgi:cell division protein FtsI (penicillin-binding protein 3)